ncbi:hypothetical protein V502_02711 [Pseudogymnoascus sp. VKM F-4520 (FW-2644)]|nr:hypothetical protein V502_02711 [Pseudogymnoascus sp. VKM F-4520 (FW-2644)]
MSSTGTGTRPPPGENPQNPYLKFRFQRKLCSPLIRYYLVGAPLEAKQDFAVAMITEEQEDMNRRGWDVGFSEDRFGELPRTDFTRYRYTGKILSGMVIRGRIQAAVFDTFMELCLQGVCSLTALEHPVSWESVPHGDNPSGWISRMLRVFRCYHVDMELVQAEWGMSLRSRWFAYSAPYLWFEIVVVRSFTSLDAVFNIIRRKGHFGLVNADALKRFEENYPPNPAWKADINTNRARGWGGSGTFACWLPDNIDPSITQQGVYEGVMALSKDFYFHLERTEMHYAVFFDIDRDAKYAKDADIKQIKLSTRSSQIS